MENQPKLNSSKEVIAFLAERFPHCFSAEGEARPLKIGIFQTLLWIVLWFLFSLTLGYVYPGIKQLTSNQYVTRMSDDYMHNR